MHQAVRRVGEGQRRHTDDDKLSSKEPIAWRDSGERAVDSEDRRAGQQQSELRLSTSETAGPIIRAALNDVELSATALCRSSSPTSSAMKV